MTNSFLPSSLPAEFVELIISPSRSRSLLGSEPTFAAGSEDGGKEIVELIISPVARTKRPRMANSMMENYRTCEMRAALAGGAMYIEIAAVLGIKDRFNGD